MKRIALTIVCMLFALCAVSFAQSSSLEPTFPGDLLSFAPAATQACVNKAYGAENRAIISAKAVEYDISRTAKKVQEEQYTFLSEGRQKLYTEIRSLAGTSNDTERFMSDDRRALEKTLESCDQTLQPLRNELKRLEQTKTLPYRQRQIKSLLSAYNLWRGGFNQTFTAIQATESRSIEQLNKVIDVSAKLLQEGTGSKEE